MEQKNLYRVVCKGMKESHGTAYVIASDPTKAYKKVKDYLDVKDIGFTRERELESITLLAKASMYPNPDITTLYL